MSRFKLKPLPPPLPWPLGAPIQPPDPSLPLLEIEALTRYRLSYLSDDLVALCHAIADRRYELAAEHIVTARKNIEVLAGCLSLLVPSTHPVP